MNRMLAVFLDILTAVLVVLPVVQGIKYGFQRRVLALIATIVSMIAAYVLSGMIAPDAYDRYVKPEVTQKCIEAAEKADPAEYAAKMLSDNGVDVTADDIREQLEQSGDVAGEVERIASQYGCDDETAGRLTQQLTQELGSRIPEEVDKAVPALDASKFDIKLSRPQIMDIINTAASSPEEGGRYIESAYAGPVILALMRSVIFSVCFVLVRLAMLPVFYLFGFDIKGRAEGDGDRAAGFALGLVTAAANVLVLCVLMNIAETASGGLFTIEKLHSLLFLPLFNIVY